MRNPLYRAHCSVQSQSNELDQILCGLRVANAVIAIVAPVSSLFVVVFFIWAATTLTTNRLIINSRRGVGKAACLREAQMQISEEQFWRHSDDSTSAWPIPAANAFEGQNGDVRTDSECHLRIGNVQRL
ncbi:hypothetical protein C8R43DRAFT_1244481 [Mycena crocata]|nr:hypothetical protein C8R43DRAFT_1244481 [Mycena crocata]